MQCTYDEPAQVYDETLKKANKIHRCCECSKKINKKEIYNYIKILYDGDWSAYKQCLDCAEIFEVAVQAGVCPYIENLYGDIVEVFLELEEKFQNYFRKKIDLPDYLCEDI
jgi:hypothetical protein